MLVLQSITANVAELMKWGLTGDDSAEGCFLLCCWLQNYAHTCTSKMQATTEEAQRAQYRKIISCWEKYCQMEQKTWLKCMIVTDKPEFNCSEYKIWKCPSFSVSICWKFAYNRSWKPNYLKGIQLYSCHSVACPTSHFAEGQTQLYTFKYSFFLKVIF